MWIFGYGSLVWKVDFPYTKKLVGYIKGYDRRFWQASIDHRGTPEKPGRVVTLVPSSDTEAKVWGAAYQIRSQDTDEVLRHLDHREVMGYEKVPVHFHPVANHPLNETKDSDDQSTPKINTDCDKSAFEVTMYYGSSENQHYIGPAPLDKIALQIWTCKGPSGANKDYLFNLAQSMQQIFNMLPSNFQNSVPVTLSDVVDSHLCQLTQAVKDLDKVHTKVESESS